MGALKLTNLQLELLKNFSYEINDKQLMEIRALLAQYFAEKATEEMDIFWEENNLSQDTMEEWSNEHMRTKYE